MNCPHCGSQPRIGSRFCDNCGLALQHAPIDEKLIESDDTEAQKETSPLLTAWIVFCLVVLWILVRAINNSSSIRSDHTPSSPRSSPSNVVTEPVTKRASLSDPEIQARAFGQMIGSKGREVESGQ